MEKVGEKPTKVIQIILNIDETGFRIKTNNGIPEADILYLLKCVVENLEDE